MTHSLRALFLAPFTLTTACGPSASEPLAAEDQALVPLVAFGPRQLKTHPSEGSRPALVGDVSGDGCADVVYAGPQTVSTYLSDCVGGFGAQRLAPIPGQGNRTPRLNDVNGDGREDLLYLGGSDARVFLREVDGSWTALPSVSHPEEGSRLPLTFDQNHDGQADLLYLGLHGEASWYLGRGNGTFLARQQRSFVDATESLTFAVQGDLRENYPRPRVQESGAYGFFLADSYAPYQFEIMSGRFDGSAAEAALVTSVDIDVLLPGGDTRFFPHPDEGTRVALVADLNADQRDDVLYLGPSDAAIYLSDATMGIRPRLGFLHADEAGAIPRLADINRDGRPDLLYLSPTSIAVYRFMGR